jgi:methylmalonyl-CoA epimerase
MVFKEAASSVDHVAFAVRSMREALEIYSSVFDYQLIYGTDHDHRQIRTMQLQLDARFKVELMEPLGPDSPLADHINRRGEGFHHMAVKVNDLIQVVGDLGELGVETLGTSTDNPTWMESYTHPRTCHGTMIQLAQTDRDWFSPFPGITVDDVLEGRLVWDGNTVRWRDRSRIAEEWPPRLG